VFESLDSNIRGSLFKPRTDADWACALTTESIVTDALTDKEHALYIAENHGNALVIEFDYFENNDDSKPSLGYDILDGNYSYSLLTNFGNDITIVNGCLSRNALIRHQTQVIEVHKWFIENMSDDNHVDGCNIFVVYGTI
jgi:hypothetical protein